MEEKDNIEDYLGGKFNDFEVEPLSGSFNAVMDKVTAAKEKKRRGIYLWAGSGIAALVLLYLALPLNENIASTSPDIGKKILSSSESDSYIIESKTAISIEREKSVPKKQSTPEPQKLKAGQTEFEKQEPQPEQFPVATSHEALPKNTEKDPSQLPAASIAVKETEKEPTTIAAPEETQPEALTSFVQQKENSSPLDVSNPPSPFNGSGMSLKADVLENIGFGVQLTANGNLKPSLFDPKIEKDLLRLQSSRFKARFFIGIGCQAIMMGQTYALNSTANTDPIKYSGDFKSSYVENRRRQSSRGTSMIPGLIVGLGMQRFEIRATFGAFQIRDYEIISYPEDSLSTTGFTNTVTSLGNPTAQNSQNITYTTHLYEGEKCGNIFNYVYGSLGINAIFRFYNFQLKPGIALSYNHAVNSSYAVVNTEGYQKYKNSTSYLNKNVYSFSLRCGVSKRLSRLIEMQVSPVYMISLSSVFDERYFLSQRFNGFGIEGALIYKFPVKLGK
ncbi:MAG: hypothetical protein JNL60_12865 [Bacteroidia bacterium]|nr:hypothetical protein [Bacteroidia bacterium]